MEDYGNRFFSEKLEINFQKWKRWAREFLPEDTPQGYKREYTLNDGFHVYLGGYLVSNLKYSIPQTKQILGDISDWLKERVYPEPTREPEGIEKRIKDYHIFIYPEKTIGFCYNWQGTLQRPEPVDYKGHKAQSTVFKFEAIFVHPMSVTLKPEDDYKILNISTILRIFNLAVR